jgi:predicted ATP-grasp superfamily ATP-dependent carboligase
MRILVFEHTCGGGLAGRPDLAGLRAEGQAMLAAVLEDLARLGGIEVRTLLDREPPAEVGRRWHHRLVFPGQEEEVFRAEAKAADAVLVIAPESDGLLAAYGRWAEEAGTFLLGPSAAAIRLCGDKRALAEWLRGSGVATPESRSFDSTATWETHPFPAVLKPRDGAGSQASFLVRNPEELAAGAAQARREGWSGEMIVQPYMAGQPASVALLIGPRQVIPLLPAEQLLSPDGRFHYLGGAVPLAPELAARAVRLARRAVEVPGLRGYVGVDVVLGEEGDWVIEVNPRLTTSYLGLRALAETNLAEAMLRLAWGEEVPEVCWRNGRVLFTAAGRIATE